MFLDISQYSERDFRVRQNRRSLELCASGHGEKEFGMKYAVIDVETTGLDPQQNRVIDIGIVLLDANFAQESFSLL